MLSSKCLMGRLFLLKVNAFIYESIKSRRKKNKLLITLILLTTLIFFIGGTFVIGIRDYRNNILENTLKSRTTTITVSREHVSRVRDVLKDLYDHDEIVDYSEQMNNMLGQYYDGDYILNGYNAGLNDSIVYGRPLDDQDHNKIVLPLFMQDDMSIDYQNKLLSPEITFVDSKDLLGKTIVLSFKKENPSNGHGESYKKAFEVIGIYDNVKNYMDLNTLLIAKDDLKQLNIDSGFIEDKINNVYEFTVRDSKDKKTITSYINQQISDVNFYDKASFEPLDQFLLLVKFILSFNVIVLAVFTIVYFSVSIDKNMKLRKPEFGLLKTLGYKKKTLIKIMQAENLGLIFFSLSLSVFLYVITLFVVRYWIENNTTIYFHIIDFSVRFSIIGLTTILLIILSLVITFRHIRQNKITDPIELIKD